MDEEIIKKSMRDLRIEYCASNARSESILNAIIGMQELCTHDWHYQGHGHNMDYYTCSICGKEEER